MKKENGFTLIELIAVLVILAILALIVTPLVMNIIRKARVSADKRSIDAYGRSIELAIATYLLDNGSFPESIDQLTIEYSGDEVVCSTSQINSDSSVYLAGCRVAGRGVDYTYGSDKSPTYTAYSVGDEVTYNNVDYYVIKASGAKESTLTLLKAEPLTVDEVNLYGGVGTVNNHVNNGLEPYNDHVSQAAYNQNGYGGMAYFSSDTCICNHSCNVTGCTNEYALSEIKYVVDAWAESNVPNGLKEARLLTYDELFDDLGYELIDNGSITFYGYTESTPNFIYDIRLSYWIIASSHYDYNLGNGVIQGDGTYRDTSVYNDMPVVRPVITINKSALY